MIEPILYLYSAKLIRIIDADSIIVKIDRGFKDFSIKTLRLARIDAFEVKGKEKEKGLEAKEWVEKTLIKYPNIIIQSLKLDSFGRSIAELWYWEEEQWINLNDKLLDLKLAIPYQK